MEPVRILIVGGGFGGVRAALDLSKRIAKNSAAITVLSDKHHFEYTPAHYKLAVGTSPLETCIPLADIFAGTGVEYVVDEIAGASLAQKAVFGKSGARYQYDRVIFALGAETAYFGIPGVAEHAYQIKTVDAALRLKRHLHDLFFSHAGMTKGQLMAQFQFVVVGGGPAGVELAGMLRQYARSLARTHGIPEKLVTVDILQSAPRLLPSMNEAVSRLALMRLDELGINIILSKAVTRQDEHGVHLDDISLNAKTIVWTAGVKPNHLYGEIGGLSLDTRGRVLVDARMRANGYDDAYVIGDSASTPYAGTAQTAIYDGGYVARVIAADLRGTTAPEYRPQQTPYVIPIGKHWAIFTYKNIALAGRIFWWLRELIDLRFFLSILPPGKALTAWRDGARLCESCPTCMDAMEKTAG